MHVQLSSVLPHVLSYVWEHHPFQVRPRLVGLEVRYEDLGGYERRLGRPVFWGGEREVARPLVVRGEDFEYFGNGTGFIATEELAYSIIVLTGKLWPQSLMGSPGTYLV